MRSLFFLLLWASDGLRGQTVSTPPLQPAGVISFEGVKGEFDHFAIDLAAKRLFLAAEDQKTVEVFSLGGLQHTGSISLFARPHGLVFIPDSLQLMVADGGDGTCKFVDLSGPKISTVVKTALRADSVAFDSATRTIFVANGGLVAKMDYSLVTAVNATRAEKTFEIKIDSKILEAMAVETAGDRLFVNLMDKNEVAVIDRVKRQILTTWPLSDAEQPSAMALDQREHRLFIGCRKPGKLLALDTTSGKTVAALPCIGHADDAYFDPVRKRVYVSGGEGAVSVYQQHGSDRYEQLEDVPTGPGAKTSLFVPELNRFFVAVPSAADGHARVLIFKTDN
jgi:DNA-binding beta-propeller fold protein YncE